MLAELAGCAVALGMPLERDGSHRRIWLRRRNLYYPCVEHALVVAPGEVTDKVGPGFQEAWEAGLAGPRQMTIVS
jgi:hypothetical protein